MVVSHNMTDIVSTSFDSSGIKCCHCFDQTYLFSLMLTCLKLVRRQACFDEKEYIHI